MKLAVTLLALALVPVGVSAANKDKENKEQLTQVARIYVAGEGPASEKVRDRIGRPNACFVLVEDKKDSDAVFYLNAPGEPSLGMSLQPSEGVGAELKKNGVTIWNSDAALMSGVNRSAAVTMAVASLVNSLERDAKCGKKKAALAQGQAK